MELDLRVSREEKLKEIINVTNQKIEEIFATFQEKMARAIKEVFAEDGGSPSSRVVKSDVESDAGEEDKSATNPSETNLNSRTVSEIVSPIGGRNGKERDEKKVGLSICKGEVPNGVVKCRLESENKEKEELVGMKSRSDDSQEKSFAITDRSLQKSYLNIDVEFSGESRVEIEHLGAPPWLRRSRDGVEANQSKIKLSETEAIPIRDYTRREMEEEDRAIQEGAVVDHVVPLGENQATSDWRLQREDLNGELEKTVLMAARGVKAENAVWVVGLNGQEPVFFLVMGTGMLESELKMDKKSLGDLRVKVGPDPKIRVSVPWPIFTSDSFGIHKTETNQSGINLIPMKEENGPGLLPVKHGPNVGIKEAAQNLTSGSPILLRQPLDSCSSLCLTEHDYQRSCSLPPPPPKPPPQPPDYPPKIELASTISEFLATYSPISLRICGKVESAGIDPGDFPFRSAPPSPFIFHAINSLEDKAGLKRLARAPTFMEGRHSEDKSFAPLPPPKPPPIPPYDLKLIVRRCMLWILTWYGHTKTDHNSLISLRNEIGIGFTILGQLDYGILSILCKHGDKLHAGENHHDRVLALFSHSPRPPDFANDEEMEIEFQTLAELSLLYTNWEGDISLDKWKLKLNIVNAQTDFRICYLQTHQSKGTLSSCTRSPLHVPPDANSVFK